MAAKKLRVLVVDDSALYRRVLTGVLNSIPGVEVVGSANDGVQGVEKARTLKPDLMTLDVEMPQLDGLGVLQRLADSGDSVTTVMVSAFTAEGARATNAALRLGAFDFVLKPTSGSTRESELQLKDVLTPIVNACRERLDRPKFGPAAVKAAPVATPAAVDKVTATIRRKIGGPKVVGIGVSTGGPAALAKLLPMLPSDFPCPVLIVQHMPPLFTKSLADDLNNNCAVQVVEAENGMSAKPGTVYIAPGGKHMRVTAQPIGPSIQITNDPPERSCRPSVDYLFRSLARHYGNEVVAAVLTGMGDDGCIGCRHLKRKGAAIVTQDEASCVVYGMPRSVNDAGLSDSVLPLERIATFLISTARQEAAAL
ncbi:MAG: chemotaxis response regulator protein-glutamate methylesterase [Planctomycetota bacterium]